MNRLIGFVGIAVLLGLAWLMSNNKRRTSSSLISCEQ